MVQITIDKGIWAPTGKLETLCHEYCPRLGCKSTRLNYPDFLVAPFCPECKTTLLGPDLTEGYGKRIAYHLEV